MPTTTLPNKLIAVLLSFALVFSFTPSIAFADNETNSQTAAEEVGSGENSTNENTADPSLTDGTDSSDSSTNNQDNSTSSTSISASDGSEQTNSNARTASNESDQTNTEASNNEANDQANSWRYIDGEQIYSYEGASTEAVDPNMPMPLAAAPGASSYATWYKSNGTTSYTYKATPSSSGQNISVSGVKRVGIDVSYHQGTIDWAKVKNSGVSFAIIRCGYGSNFTSQDDTQFLNNVRGAQANGIDIGIYLYSYAKNTTGNDSSATSEAQHVLRLLNEAGLEPSDLAYPVYYDLEENSQASLGPSKIADLATTFCNIISDAGYDVGIYANQNWWRTYLTDSVFSTAGWNKWVARYPGPNKATDSGVSGTEIWQFSDCGNVDGINGNCDMNFDYVGVGEWITDTDGSERFLINDVPQTGWVVTDTRGDGLQRYWLGSDGILVKDRFIPAEEAGYAAYATPNGYVAREKFVKNGKIYLANNDGKLEDPGWVVTSYYDGKMQRYWINEDHSAQTGFFQVGDSWYHGNTVTGYVVRGKIAYDGSFMLANNDGILQGPGWVVTNAFDGSMQRYYIQDNGIFTAKTGFFQVGDSWYHGNTVTGYVVRGKIAYDGSFMLANNDGILQGPGWVVTNAFDGSMQRYYIQDNGLFTAKTGFFEVDGNHYHGNTVTGYVVRGKANYGNGKLLADNDGVLAWEEGWLVTDKYDGSLQRYRIDNSCGGYMGAHLGQFAIDGKSYYGREDTGYVVRGLYRNPSGQYYYGNNDGVLQ